MATNSILLNVSDELLAEIHAAMRPDQSRTDWIREACRAHLSDQGSFHEGYKAGGIAAFQALRPTPEEQITQLEETLTRLQANASEMKRLRDASQVLPEGKPEG